MCRGVTTGIKTENSIMLSNVIDIFFYKFQFGQNCSSLAILFWQILSNICFTTIKCINNKAEPSEEDSNKKEGAQFQIDTN